MSPRHLSFTTTIVEEGGRTAAVFLPPEVKGVTGFKAIEGDLQSSSFARC